MMPNVRQLTHEVYTWDGLELVRRDLYDAAVEERDAAMRDKATLRDMRDAAVEERDRLRAALTREVDGRWDGYNGDSCMARLRAALHPEDGT